MVWFVLVVAVGSTLIAGVTTRWPASRAHGLSWWTALASLGLILVGIIGYLGIEMIVGCTREDSAVGGSSWNLWPVGHECDYGATDLRLAETVGPGLGAHRSDPVRFDYLRGSMANAPGSVHLQALD